MSTSARSALALAASVSSSSSAGLGPALGPGSTVPEPPGALTVQQYLPSVRWGGWQGWWCWGREGGWWGGGEEPKRKGGRRGHPHHTHPTGTAGGFFPPN